MSAIDKAHFGRDVGAGFLNPKKLQFERFHILKNSWKWLIEFLNFPSLKSVCTRRHIYIYVLFLLVFIFVNLFPFLMFLYRTMFSSFPNSIENHAHYRVSTSVCHLWGPEKRVSCHPLTGLIWAGMWRGGGFLNPKNLKFERFHILQNSWKWLIEFWNFPLLKSVCTRRHIYLCIRLVFACLYIWKSFSIPDVLI